MKLFASALLILACALPAPAQPPAPLLPAKYKVALRYYIPAPRDQHVVQYDALIRHLQRLDFEFEPPLEKHADTDREDRGKNYLKGVIKSANALKLLDASVVQSIQLVPYAPDEFKLPDGANDPVSVPPGVGGKPDGRSAARIGESVACPLARSRLQGTGRLRSPRLQSRALHAHRRHDPEE